MYTDCVSALKTFLDSVSRSQIRVAAAGVSRSLAREFLIE
jgi:hypothetical protein